MGAAARRAEAVSFVVQLVDRRQRSVTLGRSVSSVRSVVKFVELVAPVLPLAFLVIDVVGVARPAGAA